MGILRLYGKMINAIYCIPQPLLPYLFICSSLFSLTFPCLSSWVVSLNDLIWFQYVCTVSWNFCALSLITLHIYPCTSISVQKCYIYVYIFIADSYISPAREVCLKMICY